MEIDIRWDDKYASNIESLDEQHKRIFKFLKSYMDEIETGNRERSLKRGAAIFDELINTHFGTEEYYMQQYFYPQIEAHRAQHRTYDKIIKHLNREYDNGVRDNNYAQKVETVLKRYWWHHLPEFDKPLVEFLRTRVGNA